MDNSMRLQVIFSALDKLSAPLRKITGAAREADRGIADTKREILELEKVAGQVARLDKLQATAVKTGERVDVLRGRLAKLSAEMERTGDPTGKLSAEFVRVQERMDKAVLAGTREAETIARLDEQLRAAGVDTGHLATEQERLAKASAAANHKLGEQHEQVERVERVHKRAEKLHEAAEKHGERLERVGGRLAGAGLIGGLTVDSEFIGFMREATEAATEERQAVGQVDAALKSMGPRARLTGEQLEELAEKMQGKSLYHADDILRSVTANMLTFGNVAGENFERAQMAAVNMSARLKQDLQHSTIMIGKALADPIKGVTSLRRVGVMLDDQEKTAIATAMAHGDVMSAQAVILRELEHEFGGAAEAMRKATPNAEVAQDWHELQETVGKMALRDLPPLLHALDTLLQLFNKASPDTQVFVVGLIALTAALGPLFTVLGAGMALVGTVMTTFEVALAPAIAIVLAIIAAVALLAFAGYELYKHWDSVSGFFSRIWTGMVAVADRAVAWFRRLPAAFQEIGGLIIDGLLSTLDPLRLGTRILQIGGVLIDTLKKKLGIHSPSREFAAIGGHMMSGLALGLDRGVEHPLDRLRDAGRRMSATMALGLAAVSPATAQAGSVRPAAAIAAGAGAAGAGSAARHGHREYHIHVHGAAAADPRELALRIRDELRRLDADDRLASYRDTD